MVSLPGYKLMTKKKRPAIAEVYDRSMPLGDSLMSFNDPKIMIS